MKPKLFFKPNFHPPEGTIGMTIISGITLEQKWNRLDDEAKESMCLQLWDLTSKVRNIADPHELEGPCQCAAVGSLSRDPMLEDSQEPGRPLTSDWELRARIYDRYLHFEGSRYVNQLLNMLPRSKRSVFTNADTASRNIIVDEQNNVTGILDWGSVGWYPEYWEYAQIMRPAFGGIGRSGWRKRHRSGGILEKSMLPERFSFESIGGHCMLQVAF